MIEKFVRIRSVGKFDDYAFSDDVSLRRLTLLYGENAAGKTTLSAILRSLMTGETGYIEERRRLGGDAGQPEVQLLVDGSMITYQSNAWNRLLPNLEIFDDTFIADNVYAGDAISPEQRRNLHKFAIGDEGVKLAREVDEIAKEIDDVNQELSLSKQAIQQQIIGKLPFAEFVALGRHEGIDEVLEKKEKDLAAFKKSSEILEKGSLSLVSLPTAPYTEVRALLLKTLVDVSSDAERRIRAHLESHRMMERGEAWISQGLEFISEDACPFCGQSLADLDIITAYRGYFRQAYDDLKTEVADMERRVDGLLSTESLLSLQEQISGNEVLTEFWKQHVSVDSPKFALEECRGSWNSLREEMVKQLRSKLNGPLEQADASKELQDAHSRFERLKIQVDAYNERLTDINILIKAKKEQVGGGSIESVEEELERLKNTKRRHEPHVDALCESQKKHGEKKKRLESAKEDAREQLGNLSRTQFGKFQDGISTLLSRFGADFSIIETREVLYGAVPRLEYFIEINSERVNLDVRADAEPSAGFRNTLSSGDKTTLALAFFLARIEADDNLSDKVLVFDDPITSLGRSRQKQTAYDLVDLAGQAQQVLVLSHDPYFLRLVWDEAVRIERKGLCVRGSGYASIIDEWDVEEATKSAYLQNYEALVEYLERGAQGPLIDVATRIRPLLEDYLRFRFPREILVRDKLGEMVGKIRKADDSNPLAVLKDQLKELSDINSYTRPYAHGRTSTAESDRINGVELRAFVGRTLDVLHGGS